MATSACVPGGGRDSSVTKTGSQVITLGPKPSGDAYFYFGDGGKTQAKLDTALEHAKKLFAAIESKTLKSPLIQTALTSCVGIPVSDCSEFSAISPSKLATAMGLLLDLAARFPEGSVTAKVVVDLASAGPHGLSPLLAGVRPGTSTIVFALAGLQKIDPEKFEDHSILFRRMVHEVTHTVATQTLGHVMTHGETDESGHYTEDDSELIELVSLLADKLYVMLNYSPPEFTVAADQASFSAPVDQSGALLQEMGPVAVAVSHPTEVDITYSTGSGARVIGDTVQPHRTDYIAYFRATAETYVDFTVTHRLSGYSATRRFAFNLTPSFPGTHPIWVSQRTVPWGAGVAVLLLFGPQRGENAAFSDLGQYGALYDRRTGPCNVAIVRYDDAGRPRNQDYFTDTGIPQGTLGWACPSRYPGTRHFFEFYVPQHNAFRVYVEGESTPPGSYPTRDLYFWPG